MLITIMSDIFLKNNVVAESTKRIQQLEFVVDNWWIAPIKDPQNIVYLVAAFDINDDDQDQEKLEKLNERVSDLSQMQL